MECPASVPMFPSQHTCRPTLLLWRGSSRETPEEQKLKRSPMRSCQTPEQWLKELTQVKHLCIYRYLIPVCAWILLRMNFIRINCTCMPQFLLLAVLTWPSDKCWGKKAWVWGRCQVCRYKIQVCFVLQETKLWGEKTPLECLVYCSHFLLGSFYLQGVHVSASNLPWVSCPGNKETKVGTNW